MGLDLPASFWDGIARAWTVPLLVPTIPKSSHASFVEVKGRLASSINVRAIEQNRFVIKPIGLNNRVDWCRDFEPLLCVYDEKRQAFRASSVASDEQKAALRVPAFIQDEEIPVCCEKPMYFVGQIDDNRICAEPPPEFKCWWHDAASFYVFTCSVCMECKAVGQQF